MLSMVLRYKRKRKSKKYVKTRWECIINKPTFTNTCKHLTLDIIMFIFIHIQILTHKFLIKYSRILNVCVLVVEDFMCVYVRDCV